MNVSVDQMIAKYIELRDAEARINAETKERIRPIREAMDVIENAFMKMSSETGQTSFGCDAGIAFRSTSSYCNVSNWGDTIEFIKESGNYQMLKKDVSKAAVQEYIDAHGVPPPGVNFTTEYKIQIRRK